MRRKLVVAALVRDRSGRVLLSRRRDDQPMGGLWELPGGKVEDGEAPVDALARELAEELGVRCRVGAVHDVVFHRYPAFDLLMLVYRCDLHGTPRAVQVAEVAWVTKARLRQYDVLPADGPVLAALATGGGARPARSSRAGGRPGSVSPRGRRSRTPR